VLGVCLMSLSPAESLHFAPKDETRLPEMLVTVGRASNCKIINNLTKMYSRPMFDKLH